VKFYPAQESSGLIWIWWREIDVENPPIPLFHDISQSYSYSTKKDHWNTHYSRAIENQLNIIHLPFVHHNTIRRGNKTLVNGPYTKWGSEKNLLNVWVSNEVDDGKKVPLKPNEISKPSEDPMVYFKFPKMDAYSVKPFIKSPIKRIG
jgi:phenylpropionate dioxygenase-like ring-hydroxylating dioxygenase large terminal subunit